MPRFLLAFMLLNLSALAQAEIVVENAYVRAPPPGGEVGAAYMLLRNTAKDAVALVGAQSSAAHQVTLHSSMNHNGMMHMMTTSSLSIPAQGALVLKSGGAHLMLEELEGTLEPGGDVALTLHFDDGSSVSIQAPVRSVLDE
ncbi:MAG: copper chaperone PCu(A)C [Pseudomonadales bacterium]|jgi:copper(I)-binding protein|nr:copper chaperone PCu(A)C [Pseudomonadales bacterium]